MTKGEYRVGIDFNPNGEDMVGRIKRAAADLIDLIEDIGVPPASTDGQVRKAHEIARLKAVAQTDIETAAMYAVKAATKQEPKE